MLVLTRKTDQEIVIAGNIRVKVLAVRGNQVQLGIVAPEEICILRTEVRASGQVFSNTIACSSHVGSPSLTRSGSSQI